MSKILILIFVSLNMSCGVKSKPLTPFDPPEIGKGGANFTDVFGEEDEKKKKKKKEKK